MPAIGVIGWLQHEKMQVRWEVRQKIHAGMDKEDLVLLKFAIEDIGTKLLWEHASEFEYNGQMYDIVETITKPDSIFYRCWADHAETTINQSIASLINKGCKPDPQQREQQKRLLDYLRSLYCEKDAPVCSLSSHLTLSPHTPGLLNCSRLNYPPPSPPPELS
jgi:hypothetical protein